MKALVLEEKGRPLVLKDMPEPIPDEGDVIVRIHAAALNHRDLWIQKGRYSGLKYPIIPGSDGSGIVVSAKSRQDAQWEGKEVMINPSFHWGNEESHQHPTEFRILGLPENGTFAEYVKVPSSSLVEKPEAFSFAEAAAVPLAGLTAFRALITRGQLKPGEKVLISGIGGGVAFFGLQISIASQAHAWVTSGDDFKIARAIEWGASGGENYKKDDWATKLRERSGGYDLVLDGTGGNNLNHLLDLANPGGRIISYGSTLGNPAHLEIRRLFWKQLNFLGSTMGSPADFMAMVKFMTKHKIKPLIDKIFPKESAMKAMERMDQAQQFGKLVITMV